MHITLIKPKIGRMGDGGSFVDEARMEPLQIGVLAALTPPDVDISFFDDRMENIPYDSPTDLVAITVETFTARRSYEIAHEYQQRGVPVIMGGIHPKLIPEEVAAHADSVFLGDAEWLWHEVIEDAKAHRLRPIYHSHAGVPHPNILPRRDIFRGKKYLPVSLMQFGRGCRYGCTFCAISSYFDKTHFIREVKEVIREIESLDRKMIFFVDDNLVSNHEAAKIFFRELIPLKIKWMSQATLDVVEDMELMKLMAKSGCMGNVFGFESINPKDLKQMRKASNLLPSTSNYKHILNILRDHGIQSWAAFTLGHEHDTRESIEMTVDFAIESKFAFAAYNILLPYPGTLLYEKMKKENRLLFDGKWWLHPDYRFNHAAFHPKLISADELTEACFAARLRFNSIKSIISRAFDLKTNMRSLFRLGIYLTYSSLFRQEAFKKQGMRLGLH
ncbi:MAG: radical SAM protein [Bacteroidia bacterium]|nr:radical SAM protein [Bacteroidia bacterium]